jgi:hypothetical protein
MSNTYDFSGSDASESTPAAPTSPTGDPTVLDRLRKELTKKVERSRVQIEVPERPGVTVEVSPNITQHQMRAWRRQSGEGTKNGFDPTKFACIVLGHTCTGIYIDGEEAFNEDGAPLTFASPEILEMTSTTRPTPDCVQAFFGLDPHVESAALAVMDAAGYGDDVEAVDPTRES